MRKNILFTALFLLAATAVAQQRQIGLYAIGFYNLEKLTMRARTTMSTSPTVITTGRK